MNKHLILVALLSIFSSGYSFDQKCSTLQVFNDCPKTCLEECKQSSVIKKFPRECGVLFTTNKENTLVDSDICSSNITVIAPTTEKLENNDNKPLKNNENKYKYEVCDDFPEICDNNGFPSCAKTVPDLKNKFKSLITQLKKSMESYAPILKYDPTNTADLNKLCSVSFNELLSYYRLAKSDDPKVINLKEQILEADKCYDEVTKWVPSTDGMKKGASLQAEIVKYNKAQLESLSKSRSELQTQLRNIKNSVPALLSLTQSHLAMCSRPKQKDNINDGITSRAEACREFSEICKNDLFPTCAKSVPDLKNKFNLLVIRLKESMKSYEPILKYDPTNQSDLDGLCSVSFDKLLSYYQLAKSDNPKIIRLKKQILEADECYDEVTKWVPSTTGMNKGASLQAEIVKSNKAQLESLSKSRSELQTQLKNVKNSVPALLSLSKAHLVMCSSKSSK